MRHGPRSAEFDELRRYSARVGSDPYLVQGAGGNTSVKEDGILWIKASGTWLARAAEDDIFVPVRIDPLVEAVRADAPEAEKAQAFVVADWNPGGLRPSIETTVHALMPQRIVVHVHCVETIASAVETDCRTRLDDCLRGLDWAFVPYARPGLPLARAILAARRPETDVLVLGNHGLAVAAETVGEAAALVEEVGRRLARPVRRAAAPDVEALSAAGGADYVPAASAAAHGAASDPESLALAARGSLYPDHVIFLGPGSAIAQAGENADAVVTRYAEAGMPPPVSILVPGAGALMRRGAGAGAEAMAGCLGDVLRRVPADADLSLLGPSDVAALLDWDAEKYRQQLERARGAARA